VKIEFTIAKLRLFVSIRQQSVPLDGGTG